MKSIYLQQAEMEDIEAAMHLINEAKQFLKEQGVDQWQTGYPDLDIIRDDIIHRRGFFVTDGIHQFAYVCIDFEGEPSYETLKGEWKSSARYATVHRMAIGNEHKGQGVSGKIFQLTEELCVKRGIYSIRVDTDEDNAIMRHVLVKNGFEFRGTIWFDNSVKYAYDKVLESGS